MVQITRHVLTIPATRRRVHYRRCGKGPALLLVHQSPRSSAEFTGLMRKWGSHFTCIAPDTPGFGHSDPLPDTPDIADYADALCAFLDALGLEACPAYGFHSGAIILVAALKRQPRRFRCLALGGYAIWTDAEMRHFGDRYLPPFKPSAYGEHLVWLWNRMLEQSWVFPWFDLRQEARLPVAHADVQRVAQAVSDMLDSGDAYRAGYGAVLRAKRDLPPPDACVPPCLISAYDGDPLQEHIDRLGELPGGWSAVKVSTPNDHHEISLAFLRQYGGTDPCPAPAEDPDEGWLLLDGRLIHWRGEAGGKLMLHAPASELAEPQRGFVAIDLPGHGQSDDFEDMAGAIEASAQMLNTHVEDWPAPPCGDPDRLYPDMTPDRFGLYLQRAWQTARAEAFFAPWYEASATHAIPLDPDALAPEALQRRARARIRAGNAARRWHERLLSLAGDRR